MELRRRLVVLLLADLERCMAAAERNKAGRGVGWVLGSMQGRRAWNCRGGIGQGMSLAGQAFGPGVRTQMAESGEREADSFRWSWAVEMRGGATNKGNGRVAGNDEVVKSLPIHDILAWGD